MWLYSCVGQLTASLSLFSALVLFSYEPTRAQAALDFYQFSASNNFSSVTRGQLTEICVALKSTSFGMWRRVAGIVPDVWNYSTGFIFKGHSVIWSWRRDVSSKSRQLVTHQHGVTSNVALLQVEFIASTWRFIITGVTSTVGIISITVFIAVHALSINTVLCAGSMLSAARRVKARCISQYCCYLQSVERG